MWFVRAYFTGWTLEREFLWKEQADLWAERQRRLGANVLVTGSRS